MANTASPSLGNGWIDNDGYYTGPLPEFGRISGGLTPEQWSDYNRAPRGARSNEMRREVTRTFREGDGATNNPILSEERKAELRRIYGWVDTGFPTISEEDYRLADEAARFEERNRGNDLTPLGQSLANNYNARIRGVANRTRPTTVIIDDLLQPTEDYINRVIDVAQQNVMSNQTYTSAIRPTYSYAGIAPSNWDSEMLSNSTPNIQNREIPLVNINESGVNLNESRVNMNESVVEDYESLVNKNKVTIGSKLTVTTDPLFNDFLRGNRMLKEFEEEWSKPSIMDRNLKIWDRTHYISGSFDWSKTKRGHSYWASLSVVWRTIVQSLGVDGAKIPDEVKKCCE